MANLTESAVYDAGVYQIETTDPVSGGATGIANKPLINLANRTAFLKGKVDGILAGTETLSGYAKLAGPAFTGNPTAPTPALGDRDTSIATTDFVQKTLGGVLSKSVAGGSNVTLTAVEAGNGILVFTGALTASIRVIVPTAPTRPWVVFNNTTGAFTLTVKTASGTGQAVTQGKATLLYTDGVNVLDGLTDTAAMGLTGALSSIVSSDLAASRALVSDASGKVGVSAVTATELGYLDGVTSAIQTQLNGKAASSHTHSAYAPLASPAFTGAPTAPTPALFDNDTSIATTEFVRRALGNFSGASGTQVGTTLSVEDGGKAYYLFGGVGYTVNLPASSSLVEGWAIKIICVCGSPVTLSRQGSDVIDGTNKSGPVSSVSIGFGESIDIVYVGAGKFFAAGANGASFSQAEMFGSYFALAGYQKLPSGLIIQWGVGSWSASGSQARVTAVFPIAFPNACIAVTVGSWQNGTLSANDLPSVFDSGSSASQVVFRAPHATAGTTGYRYIAIGY